MREFPRRSHFDRTQFPGPERSHERSVESALQSEHARLSQRVSRTTTALLDLRTQMLDRLDTEQDDRMRDLLMYLDHAITDAVDQLN